MGWPELHLSLTRSHAAQIGLVQRLKDALFRDAINKLTAHFVQTSWASNFYFERHSLKPPAPRSSCHMVNAPMPAQVEYPPRCATRCRNSRDCVRKFASLRTDHSSPAAVGSLNVRPRRTPSGMGGSQTEHQVPFTLPHTDVGALECRSARQSW